MMSIKVNRAPLSALSTLAALLIPTACQPDTSPPPDPFAPDPWALSDPEIRIGSVDDPDFIFGSVDDMALGPDGLLYTTHAGEATIRRWTVDGAPAGSFGRKGDGPGEFRQRPLGLGFFGDSLWIWDAYGRRVVYFDLDTEYLGWRPVSADPRIDPLRSGGSLPQPAFPLRDGTLLGIVRPDDEAVERGTATEMPYVRMEADGSILGRIWTRRLAPQDILAIQTDRGSMSTDQPFGGAHLFGLDDGGLLVVERPAWTGVGDPSMRVVKFSLDGDTLFSSAVPYVPVPLARERIDSVVLDLVEWLGFDEAQIREALYQPSHLPAASRLLLGEDGTIWLQRFDPVEVESGELTNEWWVLDSVGAPMARARTPVDIEVRLVAGDMLWGIERDELDVEYIVRYRWVKDR